MTNGQSQSAGTKDMFDSRVKDLYEVLQVSPRADEDTLHRVFRHLAKRFHPDNADSGNAERFNEVMQAFQTLSDPEQRARYDARYEEEREARWRIFDQASATSDIVADRRIRNGILSLLYTARRNDPDHPGMGVVDLERLLNCPEQHMKFQMWFLKENGWVARQENGTWAITASGVDRVFELGGPAEDATHLLPSGKRD
jgi:curved DNA-binding protein CbpA